MPYKVRFFFKTDGSAIHFSEPCCQHSRMLWALTPAMLKPTPGWADLWLPLCRHHFLFYLIIAERWCSLSIRTWYSYQCPKDFFFFSKTWILDFLAAASASVLINKTFFLWPHFFSHCNEVKYNRIPERFDLVKTLKYLNVSK